MCKEDSRPGRMRGAGGLHGTRWRGTVYINGEPGCDREPCKTVEYVRYEPEDVDLSVVAGILGIAEIPIPYDERHAAVREVTVLRRIRRDPLSGRWMGSEFIEDSDL